MPDERPHGIKLCDHPDRLGARAFRAFGTDCPCCAFWRGWVIGGLVGVVMGATAMMALPQLLAEIP